MTTEQLNTSIDFVSDHTLGAETKDDINLVQVTGMMSSLLGAQFEEALDNQQDEDSTKAEIFLSMLEKGPFDSKNPLYNENVTPTYYLRRSNLQKVIGKESKVMGIYTFVDPSYKNEVVEGLRLPVYVPKKNTEQVFPSLKEISKSNDIYTVTDIQEDLDDKLGLSKVLRLVTPDRNFDGYILTVEMSGKNETLRTLVEECKNSEVESLVNPFEIERNQLSMISRGIGEIMNSDFQVQDQKDINKNNYSKIAEQFRLLQQIIKGENYDRPHSREKIEFFEREWVANDIGLQELEGNPHFRLIVVPREVFVKKFPHLYHRHINESKLEEEKQFPIIRSLGNGNITIIFPLQSK